MSTIEIEHQSDRTSNHKQLSHDQRSHVRQSNDIRQLDNTSDVEQHNDHANDTRELDEVVAEGGYGWVLVFARFLFFCLEMGTVKSFGVFVPMVIADLDTSTGLVGFAFGLVNGFTYLIGAICMVWYTPTRLVLYVAATLSTLSLVAISFCHNEIMLVIFCAITGIGYSVFPTWTIIAMREYFSKRFPAAFSLTTAGRAFGMGVFPILASFLEDVYGWRGSLLIIAGINAHLFVAAILTHTPGCEVSPIGSLPASNQSNDIDQSSSDMHNTRQRNNTRFHKSMYNHIKGYIASLSDKIPIMRIFREYPELRSFPFLSLAGGATTTGMVVFLVPSAIDKGIDMQRASVLSSLFGVGSLIGRVSVGLLITKTGWKPASVMYMFYPVCALSFIVHATCRIYWVLALNSIINGVCLGVLTVNLFILIEQTLPKELFRGGFFLQVFFYGTGSPIGGLLAGKYKDWTSSYDYALYFFVALNVVSFVVLLLSMRSSSRKQISTEQEQLLKSCE